VTDFVVAAAFAAAGFAAGVAEVADLWTT
jgi:hypothetical protein